jgi:DNA-binding CsgD family transcriptional regulator
MRQKPVDVSRTIVLFLSLSILRWAMSAPELNEMDDSERNSLNGGNLTVSEPDLPPEYCRYKDDGCDLAGSCLKCPFPNCIYEQPRGRQRWRKKLRDREIVKLFTGGGRGIKELALKFGVSQRTVQRALRNSLPKGELSGDE